MSFLLLVDGLRQDVSYALKTMRNSLAFSITVFVTLGLGIGGVTTMFTVIHSVLLKPLAYSDPDRLMRISGSSTIVRYEELKRSNPRSYSEVGAFFYPFGNVTLYGKNEPEVLRQTRVSANFLHILGVEPRLGRSFQTEDEASNSSPVMMISEDLWRRRFDADPAILGRTLPLDTGPFTVVGIVPRGFAFPTTGLDVWVTPAFPVSENTAAAINSPMLNLFGRLSRGVSITQANAETAVLDQQYASAHPGMLDSKLTAIPLKDQLVANVRAMLWMLLGAVGLVLMIGCANVAGLMLARAAARDREFAVRAALGAGRGRLIRQVVAESLVLAVAGGLSGLMLARSGLVAITGMTSFNLPRAADIRLDAVVIAFAAMTSIVTGLVFGLAPVLAVWRSDLAGDLRRSIGSSATRSNPFIGFLSLRGLLVAGQVALSLVLFIGATLLMESLARLHSVNPGFNSRNLLTMQLTLSPARYAGDQQKAAFFDELIQRVHALPGVEYAAILTALPLTGGPGRPVQVMGRPALKLNERPIAAQQNITAEYFRAMQIPLRRGRELSEPDAADTPRVLIINEALARLFWPDYPNGENPIGHHLLLGVDPRPTEIVGIVADSIQYGMDRTVTPGIYLPYAQNVFPISAFVVRTKGDPMQVAPQVRGVVRGMDGNQPVTAIRAMEDIVEDSLGQRRLIMTLLQLFASAALGLALVGLYGVIAYSVTQRTREVGVRIALGAHPSDIFRLLVKQGLGITVIGVSAGVVGALSATRVLKSFLFQISPADPVTFLGTSALFVLVALAASYLPVRRATQIDPMTVLRHD